MIPNNFPKKLPSYIDCPIPTTNKSYLLDVAFDAVVSLDYVDSMALFIGTWNTTNNAYDYAYSPFYAPVDTDYVGAKYVYEAKIAFAPNSNIGYISLLGHPSFAVYADSVIVPMIFKTIDGSPKMSEPAEPDSPDHRGSAT